MSRIDFVIFGATGFTGKKAVQETVRIRKNHTFTWAVAGRSESKLNALLKEVESKTGEDLSKIKTIIADVSDYKSVKNMCEQARVVVNCCGPYCLYGEAVVKACIDTKTHHVDVCAEPQFMERMQLQYDVAAREAGVYIISACGLDSIPDDMGVVFLQNNFDGTLNSVESYLVTSRSPSSMMSSGILHYGSWESLVLSLSNWQELPKLRKKLYPQKLPVFKPKLKYKPTIHKFANKWCVPFLGFDPFVVYRTQRYFHEHENQRPVQFNPYVKIGNLLVTLMLAIGAGLVFLMTQISCTRSLLLAYPRLFSFGLVLREGPSEEAMANTKFRVTLYGEGWDRTVTDIGAAAPNKRMTATVTSVKSGYEATVTGLMFSALTVLTQTHRMPSTGGVLTTGAAFAKTDLIKYLNENNLIFEIVT